MGDRPSGDVDEQSEGGSEVLGHLPARPVSTPLAPPHTSAVLGLSQAGKSPAQLWGFRGATAGLNNSPPIPTGQAATQQEPLGLNGGQSGQVGMSLASTGLARVLGGGQPDDDVPGIPYAQPTGLPPQPWSLALAHAGSPPSGNGAPVIGHAPSRSASGTRLGGLHRRTPSSGGAGISKVSSIASSMVSLDSNVVD
jgi:hypothetical protein